MNPIKASNPPVASIQHSTLHAFQNAVISTHVEVLKESNQDIIMECEKPIVRSHYEDPMSVPQYVDDIIGYMRELEVFFQTLNVIGRSSSQS